MEKQEQIKEEHSIEPLIKWEVPEYNSHNRDFRWYVVASIFSIILLIYSYFSSNFLLPVIMIITAFIFVLQHGQEPDRVFIGLDYDGLHIGNKYYEFSEFKNFSIVYKPKHGDKNLYFEFNNVAKPRISIPLENQNPLEVRKLLITHLTEDTERTDIPLSESLSKLFKL